MSSILLICLSAVPSLSQDVSAYRHRFAHDHTGRSEWGGDRARDQMCQGAQRCHDGAAAITLPVGPHPDHGGLDLCCVGGWRSESAPVPVSSSPCHVLCWLLEPCPPRLPSVTHCSLEDKKEAIGASTLLKTFQRYIQRINCEIPDYFNP